jgi:predicted  nucleic acid-binding Zn-ribbon protein
LNILARLISFHDSQPTPKMATCETIRNAGPKYLSLQKTLTEWKWAVAEHPAIAERVQNFDQRYKAMRADIANLDKRSKDQHDRLGKLTDNSVKRDWFKTTGKLGEKIKEKEKEFMKQDELVQSAKAVGIELESELNTRPGNSSNNASKANRNMTWQKKI